MVPSYVKIICVHCGLIQSNFTAAMVVLLGESILYIYDCKKCRGHNMFEYVKPLNSPSQ